MGNLSAIKKVSEVMAVKETELFDLTGGRQIPFPLDEGRRYIIPGYQREISWTSDNVQILIDDLKKGSKFLGTITFSTFKKKEYEVIDGQQRLTIIRLIIEFLNSLVPDAKRFCGMCSICNHSFVYFEDALRYKFDYEKLRLSNSELYNKIVESDVLNQRDTLKDIWESIEERIGTLEARECEKLLAALLESDLNVIINPLDGTDTKRKFCVDYFIDINNKSVELDSIDIIRAYAFREDFEKMSQNWIDIQNKCNDLSPAVKYSRKELFYQYFICKINEELGYALTKPLGEKYTIREDVVINGCSHSNGTFVWNLFTNDKYYAQLLDNLKDYLDFMNYIVTDGSSRSESFRKYFKISEEESVSDTTIANAFSIINSILRSDDVVPKMMIMKYYLDVMRKDYCSKGNYKVIYFINAVSLIFSCMAKKKSSELIASKILVKTWDESIKKMAYKMLSEIEEYVDYSKVMLLNKSYTVESGQYVARRYYSLFASYSWASGNVSVDEKKFSLAIITDGKKNDEHFLVNRNYEYALYKENTDVVDVKINTPRKYKSYIATLANYIWLDSEVNSSLHNRPVYEKIAILEDIIKKKGIDDIICGVRSQQHYACIKAAFYDSSKYPDKKLHGAKNKTERKKLLTDYYKNNFEDEYRQLINLLSSEARIYETYMEYMLKQHGFTLTDEKGKLRDSDTLNNDIEVTIDGNSKKMWISYEVLNPFYAEHPDDTEQYASLLEKYNEALGNILGKDLCVESSNSYGGSDDESITFSACIFSIDKIGNVMTAIKDVESA